MKEWLITPPEEFLKRLNNNKAGKPFDARDLVFGEGYTPNNVKRLIDATNSKPEQLASELALRIESLMAPYKELTYIEFMSLVNHLRPKLIEKGIAINEVCIEVGYAPYNLVLLIEALGWQADDFGSYIGWSEMKVRTHTTSDTNKDYFRQLSYEAWQQVLAVVCTLQEHSIKLSGVAQTNRFTFADGHIEHSLLRTRISSHYTHTPVTFANGNDVLINIG